MRLDFACSDCCIIHTHDEINDGVLEKLWAHEHLSELALVWKYITCSKFLSDDTKNDAFEKAL